MSRVFLALVLALSLCLISPPVFAGAVQIDFLLTSFFDNNAAQMAGGLVYTYAAGTTTPKATYLNSTKTLTAANPIVLDAYGRTNVYADGLYKIVIKDSTGVTLATYDNLEFVSAVNPASIVTTDATVSSLTANLVNLKAGTLASMTLDSSLVANSRVSNAAILAAPTLASHPVPLGYFSTQTSSQSSYLQGLLTQHTASGTNPHGTTLTQTHLVADDVVTPRVQISSNVASSGYLRLSSSGATIVGELAGSILSFAEMFAGAEQTAEFSLKSDSVSGEFSLYHISSASVVLNEHYKTIDFGGYTLTNYVGADDPVSQIYEASATPNLYLGYGSATTLISAVVPASFTAGYYSVDIWALLDNSDGTSANIGQIYLLTSGTTVQQTLTHGFASSSHSYDVAEVSGHRVLYLSPAQLVQITGVTLLSPATNPVRGAKVYISMVYLGATRKAY